VTDIITFEMSHYYAIRDKAVDIAVRDEPSALWAEVSIENGPAYTWLIDGKIAGVGGVRITHRSVGHVWAIFTEELLMHKFSGFRFLKATVEAMEETLNLRHLRTLSRRSFKESQRLLEHLNFRRVRLISGIDHYLYVRKR
jgi:hypothetical protein